MSEDFAPVRDRRWIALPYLLMVVPAWLLLTMPWWSGQWTVPWDVKAHFYPQLQFLARSIAEGESPFWTPYVFSGWGQISDPQSLIFVPAFLLLAFFNPDPTFIAMDMTVFGALLVGGMALILWFRDKGWHPAGAVVAALSFAWGASAYWRVQHTGQVISLSLLPIVMFFLERALQRGSGWYGLSAGIFAGFLAVGRDQIALISIYILVAQTIGFMIAKPWRIIPSFGPLFAGAIGGLAVVVVPIGLTWLLAQGSNRPEIDFIGAGRGSLHPADLITAFISDLFGQGAPEVDFWGPPTAQFGVTSEYLAQNMVALYAGAIPAFAILMVGILRGQLLRGEILVFTLAGLFSVIYALGWYTPGFKLFYDYLPGVKLYRRPADATFLIGFCIAVLGGYLVHLHVSREVPPATPLGRFLQVVAGITVLGILPLGFAFHADRVAEALYPLGIGILCAVAGFFVLEVARLVAGRSAFVAALLVTAFMAGDLALNNPPNESTAYPPALYEGLKRDTKDPAIAFLKTHTRNEATAQRRDRIELVGLGFHMPNASLVHKLENTLGYNPLRYKEYQEATGAHDHVGLPEQREFSKLMPGYDSLLADLLGLRYIAIGAPLDVVDKVSDPARLPLVAQFPADKATESKGVWIYENPRALPRVMFVPEAKQADFNEILTSGKWPEGYDPRRAVLLEKAGLAKGDTSLPQDKLDQAAGIVAYHNTEVTLTVDAPTDGYVVLHDLWRPWWRVSVDNQPTELLKADVLFRAVAVGKGRHTLRFTYHPLEGALNDYRAMLHL